MGRPARWLGLAAFFAAALSAAPANADINIQTGLKWVPLRYTHPIAVTGAGGGGGGGNTSLVGGDVPHADEYGWQTTSLDNYLAFFVTEQIGLQLSLDFGYGSYHHDVGGRNNVDHAYTQFGFALGGKFYLNRPQGQRVSPYLYVDFFKYFASISTNQDVPSDQVGYVAAMASPVGFDLAFGAEYFFTTSFSIGAEVLGLRLAYVSGGYDAGGDHVSESDTYVTFYTGITLNYRFLATASVHTYESDEDRANNPPPPRRRNNPPPPPPEPAPSPESVD